MTPLSLPGAFAHLLQFYLLVGIVIGDENATDGNPKCVDGGLGMRGRTFPGGNIYVNPDSFLEIVCSLDFDNPETNGYSAEDIVFGNEERKIDSKHVTVLNESTARLYIDSLSLNDTNQFYFCILKLRNESRITSWYGLPAKLVCLNYVAVKNDQPQEVSNFTCLNYNWQSLTCTWHEPFNWIQTNYSVYYWLPRQGRDETVYECAIREQTSCTWTVGTIPRYRPFFKYMYFQVDAVNEFGNISQVFKFNNYEHVMPAPPTELLANGNTTHSINLQWNIDMWSIFDMDLEYKVEYALESTQDWIVKRYSSKDVNKTKDIVQVNVTGLNYPNAAYEFKVYMKSPQTGEDYWSHPTSAILKTAPCGVSHVTPQKDTNTFEIYSQYSDHRDVLVYWKPIPVEQRNGSDDFDYNISVWENNTSIRNIRPVFVSCSYANFTNLTFNSYRFSFASSDRRGHTLYSSTVYLPRKQDVLPKPAIFTKIDKGDGVYHLSWKLNNTIDNDRITNVTLLWCESNREHSHPCTGPLNWTYLSSEVMQYSFKGKPDTGYEFAISVNSRKYSSGMWWASCSVPLNRLNRIKSVWAEEMGNSSISLRWKLECSKFTSGINGYNVTYCPVNETDPQSCAQPEKTLVVYGNGSVNSAIIVDLRPSTTYKISLFAFTDTLFGPPGVDTWIRTRDEVSGKLRKRN